MRMTIKTRLIALLALMGLLLLGSVALGTLALHLSHQSFKSVFDDRVVCLRQFSMIRDAYDDLLDVSRKLSRKTIEPAQAKERIARDGATVRTQWSAYLATYLTDEEKVLATDLQGRIDRNDAVTAEILNPLSHVIIAIDGDFLVPFGRT